MPQQIGNFKMKHIIDGNNALKEILRLRPYIQYCRRSDSAKFKIAPLSDAAHGGNESVYGKAGRLCGLLVENAGFSGRIYHVLS